MPTYEYRCTKCGHTFEAFQSMSDKPLSRCPECRSAVRRVINGGLGVIFKGSGFYSTDNKRGSVLSSGNGSRDREKAAEGSADSSAGAASKDGPAGAASKEKAPAG
jgi:putative FmdB family regulatory protein